MSASTRTAQQPLGTGQFWAALGVVTMALIAAVVIAFGSVGATPAKETPAGAAGFAAPAFLDRGSRAEIGNGTAPAFNDHGSRGEIGNGAAAPFLDRGSRGEIGAIQATGGTGIQADLGYAPRLDGSAGSGPTARRHHPR
jgi:hypothetical protein